MSPALGERRLNSQMTETPGRTSASLKGRSSARASRRDRNSSMGTAPLRSLTDRLAASTSSSSLLIRSGRLAIGACPGRPSRRRGRLPRGPCPFPRRDPSPDPPARIAAPALRTTTSRAGPSSPSRTASTTRALSSGEPPAISSRDVSASPTSAGATNHSCVEPSLTSTIRVASCDRDLVEAVVGRDHQRTLAPERKERFGDRLLVGAVRDAQELPGRPGGVGERAEEVEDRPAPPAPSAPARRASSRRGGAART